MHPEWFQNELSFSVATPAEPRGDFFIVRKFWAVKNEKCRWEIFKRPKSLGRDQKGFPKTGIHDQGDFWNCLLETTVKNPLKLGKCDLVMDTPFVDTPFGPARKRGLTFFGDVSDRFSEYFVRFSNHPWRRFQH